MARDMPIGLCCVCDEPLDLSEAGICKTCGQGFCWHNCGNWHDLEHACHNCVPELAGGGDDEMRLKLTNDDVSKLCILVKQLGLPRKFLREHASSWGMSGAGKGVAYSLIDGAKTGSKDSRRIAAELLDWVSRFPVRQ